MKIASFSKTYEGRKVLDFPGMEVQPGKIYAVIGANGSGKSTFAKILAGILPADKNSRDVVMYAYNGDGIVAFVRQSNYSDEYNVIVYDIKNSKVISEFKQKLHEKNTNHIDFCGKDRFVLCDDYYGIVYMYDINGALLAKLDLNQAIRDMIGKFTKESFYGYKVVGKYLICSSTRHIVMVDISDGRLVMSGVFDGGTFDINSAGYGVFSMNDGFAYGRLGAELSYITDKENILPVNEYISEMKISEGGNIMAFIRYENLYVYNRKTKELKTRIFNNYEKQPENITITPDEKYIIAVASDNKEIQKISVADLSTVSSLMSDKTFVYTKFEFLSESDLVISDVGDMLIVDCENMQIRADLPDGGFFIKEDNTVITSGYNKDILMYKYLTLDELMVKAEEFLVKYGN